MKKVVVFLEFKDSVFGTKFTYSDGEIYSEILDNDGFILDAHIGDIKKSLGEFLYVFINQAGVLEVQTDFCGFYSLFYKKYTHLGKQGVLISNCFHSLSQYSDSDIKLDIVLPNIFSKDQIFMQGYTNETALTDIKKLGWNENLLITKNGFQVIKKQMKIEGSYEYLLKKGVEKSQEIMKKLDLKHSLNLSLSGGKDSRAILAMLLNINLIPRCTTVSPEEYQGDEQEIIKKDFTIANMLMNKLGLNWFSISQRFAKKINFFESLERHSFYRSGYYLYKPIQYWVYSSNWGDNVQLRGGGGGLYKSTWGDYIRNGYFNKEIKNTRESFRKDSDLIFEKLSPNKGVSNLKYLSAKNHFYNSLLDVRENSNSSIYPTLDKHYIAHRNHYHFGHLRDTSSEGDKVFYPLINEYFYAANDLLSEKERNEGKMIFDIIEYCYPELNDYLYDDGYHILLEKNRRKNLLYSDLVEKSFYRMKEKEASMLKNIFSGKNYNVSQYSEKYINMIMSEIKEKGLLDTDEVSKFLGYLNSLKGNKRLVGKLLATFGSLPFDSNKSFARGHMFITFSY